MNLIDCFSILNLIFLEEPHSNPSTRAAPPGQHLPGDGANRPAVALDGEGQRCSSPDIFSDRLPRRLVHVHCGVLGARFPLAVRDGAVGYLCSSIRFWSTVTPIFSSARRHSRTSRRAHTFCSYCTFIRASYSGVSFSVKSSFRRHSRTSHQIAGTFCSYCTFIKASYSGVSPR